MPTYTIQPFQSSVIDREGANALGSALIALSGNPEARAKAALMRDQMLTGAAEREKLALETAILTGKKGVLDTVGKEGVPTRTDAEGRTVVDPNYLGQALSNQIILQDGAADPAKWQSTVNTSVEDKLARKRALEDDQRKFEQTLVLERDKPITGAPGEQIYGRDPKTGVLTDPRTGQPIVAPSPTAVPSTDRGTNGDGFPARDLNAPLDDALPTNPSPPEQGLLPGDSKLGSALGAAPGPVVIPPKTNKVISTRSQALQRAVAENDSLIDQLGVAIQAIHDNPSAFGLKNMLGQTVRGRLPSFMGGVAANGEDKNAVTLSKVMGLVGQRRHALSGSALTPTEINLSGEYLPQSSFRPETAIAQLVQLKNQIEIDQSHLRNALNSVDSQDNTGVSADNVVVGKTLGSALGSTPTPTPTPQPEQAVRISGDDEYNQLPSGSLFIGPDGQTRKKP